jgi:hypothetical protein
MLEYILLAHAVQGNATAAADAASAKATASSARSDVERLEMRVSTLELTVETLLRYITESGKISEQEFLALLQKIDAEDGRVDGRRDLLKMRRECPNCHRASAGDRPTCMWCGYNLQAIRPKQAP